MKMFHRSHIVALTTRRAKQAHRKRCKNDGKSPSSTPRLTKVSEKYYDEKTIEISHRLPIVYRMQTKLPQSSINDGESMKTLHRFTHRRLHQRHTHTSLWNDVNAIEIFHRLHISSKLH